jgi:hypothetical protein
MASDGASTLSSPLGLGDEFETGPYLGKSLVSFCTVFQPKNTYLHTFSNRSKQY